MESSVLYVELATNTGSTTFDFVCIVISYRNIHMYTITILKTITTSKPWNIIIISRENNMYLGAWKDSLF